MSREFLEGHIRWATFPVAAGSLGISRGSSEGAIVGTEGDSGDGGQPGTEEVEKRDRAGGGGSRSGLHMRIDEIE